MSMRAARNQVLARAVWFASLAVCFSMSYFLGTSALSAAVSPGLLRDAGYHKYSNGDYQLVVPESNLGLTEIGRAGQIFGEIESMEVWAGRDSNCEIIVQNRYFEEGTRVKLFIGPSSSYGQYDNFDGPAQFDLSAINGESQSYRYIDFDGDGNLDLMLRYDESGITEYGMIRIEEQWVKAVQDAQSGEWVAAGEETYRESENRDGL